jgi:CRISPR-associated protein Csc1
MVTSMHIARCHMTLHDNLFYASREFGRFYETEKYLHNYGLTYALGLVQPAPAYFNGSQEPRYQEELQPERVGGCYVTPAHPLRVDFAFITFKMANAPYYSDTPKESKNRVVFGRAKELVSGSTFEFYVFAEKQRQLPTWIRLGKWMAKAEILYKWYTVGTKEANAIELKEPQRVACPINPLDIPHHRLSTFDIVVMPPASLLTNPRVTGPCCKLSAESIFHDKKDSIRYVPLYMGYFGGKVTV